jgi:hypothetical protein
MKRFIITEEEKKEIRKKYGLDEDFDLTYPPFNQRDDEEEEDDEDLFKFLRHKKEPIEKEEIDVAEVNRLKKQFRQIISKILMEFEIKKRGLFLSLDFIKIPTGYEVYLNQKYLIDCWNSEIYNLIGNDEVEDRIREVFKDHAEQYFK